MSIIALELEKRIMSALTAFGVFAVRNFHLLSFFDGMIMDSQQLLEGLLKSGRALADEGKTLAAKGVAEARVGAQCGA